MNQDIQHLISVYGYWLMAFGAIIEGETFLIAGGIAAQRGYFHLWGLILLAVIGSTLHDCFFFYIGRTAGAGLFKRKPQYYDRAKSILDLFDRYGVWLIIALRFAYGLRTIIPTVIGVTHISFRRFLFFDLIGGVIWSATFIVGGYLFGATLEAIVGHMEQYEYIIGIALVFVVVCSLLGGIGIWFYRRSIKKQNMLDLLNSEDKK